MLGVYFHNTFDKTQKTTWNHIVQNIQTRAETQSTRSLSFFGKKININTLQLSKAWHVATVIPSTQTNTSKINSTVFSYLFAKKKPQKPPQDVLKLNYKQGGIGILDFHLQQRSLRMNRLRHILDPSCTAMWVMLPRLYLGNEIFRRNNEWIFFQTLPKIDYEDPNIRYFNINVPFYLQEFLEFLRKYKYPFLRIKNPSTHLIYQMFLRDKAAATKLTCQDYWNGVVDRVLPWKKIWPLTYKSLFKGKYLDTYYWFLQNSLPSGHKMRTSRRPYDNHCRRCHRYETTIHIFAECPFARGVWNKYFYIYSAMLERPQVNYTEALFSTALPKDKHRQLLLLTITTLIVHELWRARCKQYKEKVPTNVANSTRIINSRIRIIHFAYAKKCFNYVRRLCIPSPICNMDNGLLNFTLPDPDDDGVPVDSDFTSDDIVSYSSDDTII